MCVCVHPHPLNKDFSQAVIGTFYKYHFQKMVGWVAFKFFFFMLKFKLFKMCRLLSLLSYCDSCSACEKSFLTGKECPVECAH